MNKEAMKLALEAFGEIEWSNNSQWQSDRAKVAITALQKALAEQLAQQEPVAWMHTMIDDVVIGHRPADIDRHPDRWTALYQQSPPCQTCEALARTVMLDQTYHDNISPQRPWVGLTDEEVEEVWHRVEASDFRDVVQPFAQAIEAKLKEKNT